MQQWVGTWDWLEYDDKGNLKPEFDEPNVFMVFRSNGTWHTTNGNLTGLYIVYEREFIWQVISKNGSYGRGRLEGNWIRSGNILRLIGKERKDIFIFRKK